MTGQRGDELHHGTERRPTSVAFGVVDLSSVPVRVGDITAVTPLGGLRLTGRSIARVSCRQTANRQGARILPPGQSLAVRFTFDQC